MRKNLLLTSLAALAFGTQVNASEMFGFRGDRYGARFGCSVSSAGDVNNDGTLDIIVGAREYGGGEFPRGYADVFSGKDGKRLHHVEGLYGFGDKVGAAGDPSGDGWDDFLVGGVSNSFSLFSGRTGAELFSDYLSGSTLGYAFASVGDINFDGRDDFAVGAPYADTNGYSNNGMVRIYSGWNYQILRTYHGSNDNARLGFSLSPTPDYDNDGRKDLLIGIPGYRFRGLYYGGARIYSTASSGNVLRSVYHTSDGDFGFSVDGGHDVNGDGIVDLVVGAPFEDSNGTNAGMATVRSGANGEILYSWYGEDPYDNLGRSVASIGDMDGDGYGDVLVGAPNESGTQGLFYYEGAARVYSGFDGSVIRSFLGFYVPVNSLGFSVAAAGDVNKDGFADLIIGDPDHDEVANGAGAAMLYSGKTHYAAWSNYGSGFPGTHGVPEFTSSAAPKLCGQIDVTVGNSSGLNTAGTLFIGMSSGWIPTGWGGSILVGAPWTLVSLVIPGQGLTLPFDVICDSSFAGVSVYMQVLQMDFGAQNGISFTRGLELLHGY